MNHNYYHNTTANVDEKIQSNENKGKSITARR